MQAAPWATYSSYAAVAGTGSSTTPVTCRAIWINAAGTLTVAPAVGGTQVSFTVAASTLIPLELNQGIIAACPASTVILQ